MSSSPPRVAHLTTANLAPASSRVPDAEATHEGALLRDAAYPAFWKQVGLQFPDLAGAPSTQVYRRGEERLIRRYLGPLKGRRVFKTDLWDESRNTHILQWVQSQGAEVVGIDISLPVAASAREEFGAAPAGIVGADVRELPFADASFDAVYSMGTIEHFAETSQAIREIARVLKPGGRALIGVPNRHDPFLRPLLVELLWRLNLYDYGFEKSYSRRQLREMVEREGLRVSGVDGLLFMPGWLRMLDLWVYTRRPRLSWLVAPLVRACGWLERRWPGLAKHGYLIAAVAERPEVAPTASHTTGAGVEILIDAMGCRPDALSDLPTLQHLFADILSDTGLRPVGAAQWHAFEGGGGITGLQLLAESHLACHTYPETGYAAFSLYCCRPGGVDWPWEARLIRTLGASQVTVRTAARGPR